MNMEAFCAEINKLMAIDRFCCEFVDCFPSDFFDREKIAGIGGDLIERRYKEIKQRFPEESAMIDFYDVLDFAQETGLTSLEAYFDEMAHLAEVDEYYDELPNNTESLEAYIDIMTKENLDGQEEENES